MKRDTQIGTCSVNSSLDVTTTTQADGARAPSASLPHTGYAYRVRAFRKVDYCNMSSTL